MKRALTSSGSPSPLDTVYIGYDAREASLQRARLQHPRARERTGLDYADHLTELAGCFVVNRIRCNRRSSLFRGF